MADSREPTPLTREQVANITDSDSDLRAQPITGAQIAGCFFSRKGD
jgi:hypothetical protein